MLQIDHCITLYHTVHFVTYRLLYQTNIKAIVKLFISLNNDPKPTRISIKMIYSQQWRVYDVVFSGVSLIKTYGAQFDSHIKRKGIDSLTEKLTKKLAKD